MKSKAKFSQRRAPVGKVFGISRTLRSAKAFSIIELTIVIILIGLLSIAVLTGGQLIAEAKTRSVINKITDFEKAIFMFQKIHDFLPGDFPNTNIWLDEDIANACYKITDRNGTIATGNDRPNQAFIKGDGDGKVSDWSPSKKPGESEFVNCHLVLGGMLSNAANVGMGIAPSPSYQNTQEIKRRSGYFIDKANRLSLFYINPSSDWGPPGNSIYLGNAIAPWTFTCYTFPSANAGTALANPCMAESSLTFATLRAIDVKMDDGKPGTGQVVFGGNNNNTKLCNKLVGNHHCAPDSGFSTTTAKNEKYTGWLIYRPRWLNSNW